MSRLTKINCAIGIAFIALLNCPSIQADEGRYQAHWNGKSYLIMDTDNGHMWTFHGDSILYNGRINGADFIPPDAPKIWQQNHGKWQRQN